MQVTPSDTPDFLSLSREELGNWKELAVTRAFLDWVNWEVERGKDAVVDLLYAGKVDLARTRTGTLFALYNILGSLDRPMALPEPDEESFIDPATRPSTLRRTDATEG